MIVFDVRSSSDVHVSFTSSPTTTDVVGVVRVRLPVYQNYIYQNDVKDVIYKTKHVYILCSLCYVNILIYTC